MDVAVEVSRLRSNGIMLETLLQPCSCPQRSPCMNFLSEVTQASLLVAQSYPYWPPLPPFGTDGR